MKRTSSGFPPRGTKARPVNENDFLLATQKVKKTGESARQFHKKEFLRSREERATTAAEISRATKGSSQGSRRKEAGDGPQSQNGRSQVRKQNGTAQDNQIDMNQLMAMAMAAASSMNLVDGSGDDGLGLSGISDEISDGGEADDSSIPEI